MTQKPPESAAITATLNYASWDLFDEDSPRISGVITDDTKGRFLPGERILTSPVIEYMGNRTYRTKNSVYKVEFSNSEDWPKKFAHPISPDPVKPPESEGCTMATARPWHMGSRHDTFYIINKASSPTLIAAMKSKTDAVDIANAKLIVRAVNQSALFERAMRILFEYRTAQSRLRDRYAEGDTAVKIELWNNLHKLEDEALSVLEGWKKYVPNN